MRSTSATTGTAAAGPGEPAPESAPRLAEGAPSVPSFEQIYAERFHDVLRWLRALGGLDADLDDLAQEVFVIVQRKLHDFDGQNLGAWLYKIAKNHVCDYRRRAWMRRIFWGSRPVVDSDEEVPLNVQRVPTPLEALQHREIVRFVTRTLDKMPLAQRSAFVLFEIEGYTGEEIAELEGIPLATVWTRVHYARKRFVELLARAEREGKLP